MSSAKNGQQAGPRFEASPTELHHQLRSTDRVQIDDPEYPSPWVRCVCDHGRAPQIVLPD